MHLAAFDALTAWVVAVARFVMLIAPLVIASREDDVMRRMMLVAVWGVLGARWVFTKIDSRWRNSDFLAEMALLLLAACKLFGLSTQTVSVWLLPLLAVVAAATCVYLSYEAPPSLHTVTPTRLFLVFLLMRGALVLGQGALLVFLDTQNTTISTRSALLAAEAAVSVVIVTRPTSTRGTRQWMLLQLCTLPFYYARADLLFVVCIFIILAVGMLVAMEEGVTRRFHKRQHGLRPERCTCDIVGYGLHLAGQLLASPALYLVLTTTCACVLISVSMDKWYTATASFPPLLQSICSDITAILQEAVKPIWVFTGDPLVQEILVPAASEVSLARLSIYRAVYPLLPLFVQGRDGISQSYTPSSELAAVLAFLAGPVLTLLAIAASLFPNGDVLTTSSIFWLVATFSNAAFLVITQVATGLTAQVVRVIFVESEYERNYTNSGELALLASGGLLASCFMMTMVGATVGIANDRDEEDAEDAADYLEKQRLRAAQYVSDQWRQLRKNLAGGPLRWIGGLTKFGLQRIGKQVNDGVNFLLAPWSAPYFLPTVLAVFILVVMIGSAQSPVSDFKMEKIVTLPAEFEWFELTTLDQLSPGINSLVKLLVNAIGPEVRLIPLIALAVRIGEGALECIPCLCLSLNVFEDPASLFSRRRLLDIDGDSDNIFDFDPDHPCTARSSSSCDGIRICAADVFKPVASLSEIALGLFTTAITYAVDFLVLLFREIPHFSEIDDAFEQITKVMSFVDFDFTQYANFDLPSIGTIALPSVRLPSYVTPNVNTLVVAGCLLFAIAVLLAFFGLFGTIISATFKASLLTTTVTVWAWLLVVVVFLFELRTEVIIFTGYKPVVELHTTNCIIYLVALVLLGIATITLLAEVFITSKSGDRKHIFDIDIPDELFAVSNIVHKSEGHTTGKDTHRHPHTHAHQSPPPHNLSSDAVLQVAGGGARGKARAARKTRGAGRHAVVYAGVPDAEMVPSV